MKHSLRRLLLPALLISLFFISEGSSQYRGRTAGGDAYTTCNENCKSFSGQARYNCLRTCISATRRTQPGGSRRSSKYSRCAELCKSLKGLDGVKCIRVCMERGSSVPPARRESEGNSMLKSCERRCETLDGNYRYRCIRACQQRHRRRSR